MAMSKFFFTVLSVLLVLFEFLVTVFLLNYSEGADVAPVAVVNY